MYNPTDNEISLLFVTPVHCLLFLLHHLFSSSCSYFILYHLPFPHFDFLFYNVSTAFGYRFNFPVRRLRTQNIYIINLFIEFTSPVVLYLCPQDTTALTIFRINQRKIQNFASRLFFMLPHSPFYPFFQHIHQILKGQQITSVQ